MFPLEVLILAELARQKGALRDKELYENIKKLASSFNEDISQGRFRKALMMLEIRGYIRVESIKKSSRIVYLVRDLNKEK
ncbi:MAG TPA: hypothetical protein ENF80_04465 [Thermofilum sp.]|nr:hypothetical protein [Thermofilum sp.]